MATSFKKTSIQQARISKEKTTPDGLYWKNLQTPVIIKEYGAITDVNFCPTSPYNFAVTNSMRVQLYRADDHQPVGTVSRFKDVVYSGSFRRDGGLLVAGTEDKLIKLFNPASRSLLRTFKGHTGPVHVTKFLDDQFRIFSGANDKTVRVWDIPTEKEIHIYQDHQDYIRSGVASMSSQDLFLTGSYDHTVRLWDARVSDSVMTVNHGGPVDSVLMFPNGGIFLSAGGNSVKVWDALAGGKLLATLTNHHKTVTSLCFCSNYERFMSASLDKHVKVYDVATYQVVHTLTYSAPILSHAVSPDDQVLVVGMADKMLSIQHRKEEKESDEHKVRQTRKNGRTRGHAHTMRTFVPSKTDSIVTMKRKELLAPYDKHLKTFNHHKALDAALSLRIRKTTPEVTVSVLQELIRRGHIRPALSGRDDSSLCMLLQFIQKNLSNPQFMGTLLDIFNMILDIYGMSELVNSGPIQSLILRIKELINTEVHLMKSVQEIMGSLNLLFNAAENNAVPTRSSSVEKVEDMEIDTNLTNGRSTVGSKSKAKKEGSDTERKSTLMSIGSLASSNNGVNV